ncbi:nuclear transport factor 2 family protein [Kitasatospora acidiphila]|uniref:Nuclear transport factor 2 family protein n=1 Tax=Kitasatospora acidiphila TaxID=2567942 RepID=A0A540W7A6_9ACTN|nr:nuclear transport factor 2 family protein [Kitasatospora acidiphila]TQF04889.1 nuclear transport factor 2 family protein [Kitasatospora acidiphila]
MTRRRWWGLALGLAVLLAAAAVTLSLDPVRATVTEAVRSDPTASSPQTLDQLPPAARAYVDAVAAKNLDGLVAAFAPDGVVVDVGRQIRGRDAIRQWAGNEVIGGRLTVLRATARPGGTTMLVVFAPGGSGGFRADYAFDLSGGLISRAELTYAD